MNIAIVELLNVNKLKGFCIYLSRPEKEQPKQANLTWNLLTIIKIKNYAVNRHPTLLL